MALPAPKLRGIGFAQHTGGQGLGVPRQWRLHIPQTTAVPVRKIVPAVPVNRRVEADAFNRHAARPGQADFPRHVVQPLAPAIADMAGFGQQHRRAVALPDRIEQFAERLATRVAQMPVQGIVGLPLIGPLVVVVIVDADDVKVPGRAAELWFGAARQHVPGLKSTSALLPRRFQHFRNRIIGRRDMNQGVAVHEACLRVHAANRIAGLQGSSHQLDFYRPAVTGKKRAPGMLHQAGR